MHIQYVTAPPVSTSGPVSPWKRILLLFCFRCHKWHRNLSSLPTRHETRHKHSVHVLIQTAALQRCQAQKIWPLCKNQPFKLYTQSIKSFCLSVFLKFSVFCLCKHASALLRLAVQEEQSPKTTGRAEGGVLALLTTIVRGGSGWKTGSGLLGVKSSAPDVYLEIMELDCEWLEEVVAALSWEKPLWLDSRLVMEPLRKETEPEMQVSRHTLHMGQQTQSNTRATTACQQPTECTLCRTMQLEKRGGGVTLWHTRLRLDRTATTTNSAAVGRG